MPRILLFILFHDCIYGCLGFTTAFLTKSKSTIISSPTGLFGIPIPIFHLRRTVRLPTEPLTLNLYEERYLELAEYVLSQKYPYFGAIYSSNKPQIVRNGTGPIVPLFERGDVGVLFFVQDSEEAMIPTRGGIPRRRIRLVAKGSVRFQIEEILQNGYDTSFILVDASLYMDHPIESKEAADEHCSQEFMDWAKTTQAALNLDPIHEHLLSSELASFHDISRTIPDGRSRERLAAIKCRNTQERLEQPSEKPLFAWWR